MIKIVHLAAKRAERDNGLWTPAEMLRSLADEIESGAIKAESCIAIALIEVAKMKILDMMFSAED